MVALCLLAAAGTLAASDGTRFAYIVGNQSYPEGDRLATPAADARLMAKAFSDAGYDVVLRLDRTTRQLNQDVADFGRLAAGRDVAVFYYAGHGFEFGGENYLLGVDTREPLENVSRAEITLSSLPLSGLLSELDAAAPGARIVIIDACRTPAVRSTTKQPGLRAQTAPKGTLLAYSTSPGKLAWDGFRDGRDVGHSPFAYFLSETLLLPDVSITEAMELTIGQVAAATADAQRPWFHSSLDGPLRMASPIASSSGSPKAAPSSWAPGGEGAQQSRGGREKASALWEEIDRRLGLLARNPESVSLSELETRVAEGQSIAATELGYVLQLGVGVRRDPKRAVELFGTAAEAGNAVAQAMLGIALMRGEGIAKDVAAGRGWLERSAIAGYQRANELLQQALLESSASSLEQIAGKIGDTSAAAPSDPLKELTALGFPLTPEGILRAAELGKTEVLSLYRAAGVGLEAVAHLKLSPLPIHDKPNHLQLPFVYVLRKGDITIAESLADLGSADSIGLCFPHDENAEAMGNLLRDPKARTAFRAACGGGKAAAQFEALVLERRQRRTSLPAAMAACQKEAKAVFRDSAPEVVYSLMPKVMLPKLPDEMSHLEAVTYLLFNKPQEWRGAVSTKMGADYQPVNSWNMAFINSRLTEICGLMLDPNRPEKRKPSDELLEMLYQGYF